MPRICSDRLYEVCRYTSGEVDEKDHICRGVYRNRLAALWGWQFFLEWLQFYPGTAGGTPNRVSASLMATAKHPPVNLTMLAFEPLGEEIRIVLPDAVGAVVHGRLRLFLFGT